MANIQYYIDHFFPTGSPAKVQARQREILAKFVSWEEQTLMTEQIQQALINVGIRTGKGSYLKGTHTISFGAHPMIGAYKVSAVGTSSAGATVNVIIVNDALLTGFTIIVVADCVVRWDAIILTQ